MSDEELDEYLHSHTIKNDDLPNSDITKDSSGSGKILRFPGNNTKH